MLHNHIYPKQLAWLMILLASCAAVNGSYIITPEEDKTYAPTHTIDILHKSPQREHRIIARFTGHETDQCPKDNNFCGLRLQGQKLGAHAAWIQKHSVSQQPGEWIQVEGKMTKIHAYATHYTEGVFIRYSSSEN